MIDGIVWVDSYNRKLTLKDIEDTHLANIVLFLKTKPNQGNILGDREAAIRMFEGEAKRRGLSKDFLNRAEIPHKNPRNGKWMLWDDKTCGLKPVSK